MISGMHWVIYYTKQGKRRNERKMGQFCKKCGTPLRDAAKFCPSCGQKVEEADEKKTLVERVRNNDTEAWEELYKKTYPKAYTVAIQTLKNKEDALDVLQDAYVSVFKKIDTLRDESKLEAWVNRIVANRCIDHIRKYRGNNVATPFVEMTPDDSDVEFEDILENENKEFMPEESVDYGATKKIMQGILNQLSEEQRLCVLMYYYEELSISEIADALDCSTGTVKSRLNYARKYIKNEVENLEKKGTKLYSIAPLPFLVWMLRNQENTVQVQAAEKEVWQAIQDKDGVVTEAKDIDDNAKHSRQIESQKAEQKTAQETVRQAAKNSGKAAVKTGAKGIAIKIVAGVVAVALVGTGVGLGYMKQHKKPVKVAEQTEDDKKEKPATTEEKTSEKFVLTEEQIREIKVAAALFDNCFASYNTESGDRIEYSTLLDQDHISPKVLKAVARGWACTDESIGEDLGDDYEEDDISSYVSRKYMKTDECQEFLKDTFGYEADDWDEVSEVFAPSGNSHAEVFEASFDGFQSINYNVERCEQTSEDEYHFYVKAESEEYSNTGYGLMNITAYKDEKSKFGGFVFDKIEFTANKTDDIKHDLSLIIQNMIKEDGEISGLDSQYDPIGVHEVAKFTNDQFLSYANRIIDSSRCIAKDKEYKEGEGGYGGHTLPKERFIEICENTLGWKNGNLDISSLVEGNKAHFYREDLDTISAWFGVDMMTVVQSADGSVQINGTVRDYRKESDQYDYQYNLDPRVVYSFTASGKADEKSELGTVIEKVEVLELVSGTVDSSPVQAGYTEIENKVVEAEEWKQAYIDWVNGWITKSNLATFQLFDLNGDAIPEIVAFGSDMSEGAEVATWGVGTVQTIPLDRMEAHYIPGGNVIDNSGGMSEDWYDTIYKIQDGQWVQIGNGTYSVPGPDEPDIPMEDENGNYNFINFKWNGTPMSKEDYQQQVKKLIDLDNAVFMDGENNSAVSVSEIVSQIENY
jgi:RNA polymerase sigma factor (sigma-70 family)